MTFTEILFIAAGMALIDTYPRLAVGIIVAVCLFGLFVNVARAEALWDWYFGPNAVACDAIGVMPEMATAVAHRLQIAGRPNMIAWFATHPEYREEIASRRQYYRTHCRKDG